ncbi:MAG: sensor histidine kinase, partial [Bdellovibrionota bacterium]
MKLPRNAKAAVPYFYTILICLAGIAIRLLLRNFLPTGSFSIFTFCVMLASWIGGLGPGILAAVISVAVSLVYFLPPQHSMAIESLDVFVQVAIFVLISVMISWLNHARSRASESARELAEAKSRFLANMSHEIRTPMTGVIGLSQQLLETPLSEIQRECVRTIQDSGERLLETLNSILSFSKGEAKKLQMETRLCSVRELVEEQVRLFTPAAAKKGLTLELHLPAALHSRYQAASEGIRQILSNLLSNAVRFTDKGAIHLRVRTLADGGATGHELLRFEVEDSGIGISPEAQSKLFEP